MCRINKDASLGVRSRHGVFLSLRLTSNFAKWEQWPVWRLTRRLIYCKKMPLGHRIICISIGPATRKCIDHFTCASLMEKNRLCVCNASPAVINSMIIWCIECGVSGDSVTEQRGKVNHFVISRLREKIIKTKSLSRDWHRRHFCYALRTHSAKTIYVSFSVDNLRTFAWE